MPENEKFETRLLYLNMALIEYLNALCSNIQLNLSRLKLLFFQGKSVESLNLDDFVKNIKFFF